MVRKVSMLACALAAGCGASGRGYDTVPLEPPSRGRTVERIAELAELLSQDVSVHQILSTVGAARDPELPQSMSLYPSSPSLEAANLERDPERGFPHALTLEPIDAARPSLGALSTRFGTHRIAPSGPGEAPMLELSPSATQGPWSVAILAMLDGAPDDLASRVVSITLRRDPPERPTSPSMAELVEQLGPLFPPGERAAALRTLADVVQWDARGAVGHPHPHRVLQLVHEGLVADLGDDPSSRTERLREIVCDRRFGQMMNRIHGLAVARFLRDRGGLEPRGANEGDIEPARPFLRLSARAFETEVARAIEGLAAWQQAAPARCFESNRPYLIHSNLALRSAADGAFDAASGSLYVFLRGVGANPRSIDIH